MSNLDFTKTPTDGECYIDDLLHLLHLPSCDHQILFLKGLDHRIKLRRQVVVGATDCCVYAHAHRAKKLLY